MAAVVTVAPHAAGADTGTFSNTGTITIPQTGSSGVASPYPSPIAVTGLTGTVTDVNVTLTNMSHAIASDVDVLLVGPAGQNLIFMSDVKGDTGFPISNATLTFDDSAAGQIPATGALTSGTFQPTNRLDASAGGDSFPAPAPTASSSTALSVFNGTNPNGTWNLYVVDDADGDTGSIAGGWSITVTTGTVAQPGALEFTSSSFRGAEGNGPVSLTLRRTGGSDGAVAATIATTTPATATPGLDFTPINQTVTFANGQTVASIPLTILNDTAVEGVDETVTVALSNPTGGATLGSQSTTVVRIDDNDATFDTSPITIPGAGTGATTGAPATPYPASIHVTGQPSAIGGVAVTLNGVAHSVPVDIDILLVGPGGLNVVLMSDVGGQNPASGVNLTFSDAGASTIPVGGPLATGTFRPSDDDTGGADAFPGPAPAPSTATSLAAFVGTNPNGVWNLYVVDDASGDTGTIANGWSLTFAPFVAADAGGPYTVGEGSPLTLNGTGSVAAATATYAWDIDNDGQFDDATGSNPTVSAATLATLGFGDGPAAPTTIRLQVTDGTTVVTDTSTLTITNVAPTASVANVPAGIVAGTSATLTFSATDPSAADTAAGFTFAIDWGDGTPVQSVTGGASVSVAHTWAASGTFTVSVTATDKDGGTSAPATASVAVAPLVVSDAGGPYTVAEGDDLTLDATASTAGPSATFAWDLDSDGAFDDATGANPTVTAATLTALGLDDGPAGPLPISVQVTDGPSVAAAASTLTITNVAPTASVTNVPAGIVAGTSVNLDFSASDPSAADTAAGFTFAIDWGDGTPAQSVAGGASVSVAHTWATSGTFTVTVTATDKDGGTSAPATASPTVSAAVPVVVADAGGPYTIAEGDDLALDGTGTSAGPTVTYAWDLDNDGQFDDANGPSPTLTPDDLDAVGLADGPAGPVTITLQVTEGVTVDTATAQYSITNVAPVATVDRPNTIVAGTPVSVKFGAIDPSPTDAAAQFEYRIDWEGDGTVDDVVTGPADPLVTHTYASASDVGLTVVAVDKDGAASTPTVEAVTVEPATPTTTGTGGSGGTTGSGGTGGTSGTGGSESGGTLPRTGSEPVTPGTFAAALLGVGAALAFAARLKTRYRRTD